MFTRKQPSSPHILQLDTYNQLKKKKVRHLQATVMLLKQCIFFVEIKSEYSGVSDPFR